MEALGSPCETLGSPWEPWETLGIPRKPLEGHVETLGCPRDLLVLLQQLVFFANTRLSTDHVHQSSERSVPPVLIATIVAACTSEPLEAL